MCIVFEVGVHVMTPLVEWCLTPSPKGTVFGLGSGGQFSSENLFVPRGFRPKPTHLMESCEGGTPELEQPSKTLVGCFNIGDEALPAVI